MTSPSKSRELAEFVGTRIASLTIQAENGSGKARSAIASLRRSDGVDIGSDPALWESTLGLPETLAGRGDAPSKYELAAFAALSLWAKHSRQGIGSAHQAGCRFGVQIARLTKTANVSPSAVERRFNALAASTTLAGINNHGRGLVSQMANNNISLDYGRFAVDILGLQSHDWASSVRYRWGRDYIASTTSAKTTEENN